MLYSKIEPIKSFIIKLYLYIINIQSGATEGDLIVKLIITHNAQMQLYTF